MADKQLTVTIKVEGIPEVQAMLEKAQDVIAVLSAMLRSAGMSQALIDKVIADA